MAGPFGTFQFGVDVPASVLDREMAGRSPAGDLLTLLGENLGTLSKRNTDERRYQEGRATNEDHFNREMALKELSEQDQAAYRRENLDALREHRRYQREDRAKNDEIVWLDPNTGQVLEAPPSETPETPGAPAARPMYGPQQYATHNDLDRLMGGGDRAAPKFDISTDPMLAGLPPEAVHLAPSMTAQEWGQKFCPG